MRSDWQDWSQLCGDGARRGAGCVTSDESDLLDRFPNIRVERGFFRRRPPRHPEKHREGAGQRHGRGWDAGRKRPRKRLVTAQELEAEVEQPVPSRSRRRPPARSRASSSARRPAPGRAPRRRCRRRRCRAGRQGRRTPTRRALRARATATTARRPRRSSFFVSRPSARGRSRTSAAEPMFTKESAVDMIAASAAASTSPASSRGRGEQEERCRVVGSRELGELARCDERGHGETDADPDSRQTAWLEPRTSGIHFSLRGSSSM